jgi:hypothetical protein
VEARRGPGEVIGLGASHRGVRTGLVDGDGVPNVELLEGTNAELLDGIPRLPQRQSVERVEKGTGRVKEVSRFVDVLL